MHKRLEPKLEGYSLKSFSYDLIAGLIVGIVALPLAIAFAIAAGVKPDQGIYTAVVAGFAAAALYQKTEDAHPLQGWFTLWHYS